MRVNPFIWTLVGLFFGATPGLADITEFPACQEKAPPECPRGYTQALDILTAYSGLTQQFAESNISFDFCFEDALTKGVTAVGVEVYADKDYLAWLDQCISAGGSASTIGESEYWCSSGTMDLNFPPWRCSVGQVARNFICCV